MPAISCSAPGKVILCGEHAAVYGSPAIALPVFDVKTKCTIIARPSACTDEPLIVAPNIALRCHLHCLVENHPIRAAIRLVLSEFNKSHLPVCEIQIHSTLPTAAGLGSSASTSVALIRALSTFLGRPFENDLVNDLAFEIEKIHHGTPSGIDNSVITYQKGLFFIKGKPFEFLKFNHPFSLVIADSGIKSTTGRVVEEVKNKFLAAKTEYTQFFNAISEISAGVRDNLLTGDFQQVGSLLVKNHEILNQMGVSCPKLDLLVQCAMDAGAYGAKLSGGGQGGNMIALVDSDIAAESIAHSLKNHGAVNTIITHFPAGD